MALQALRSDSGPGDNPGTAVMDADEQEGDFQEFAEGAAGAQINFGDQSPIRRAAMLKAMRDQKPSWQTDGKGIRGDAEVVSHQSAQLHWPSSSVARRADPDLDQGETIVAAEVPTGE
jgi:hypothetical protein